MKYLVVLSLIVAVSAGSYVNFTLEIHGYQANQNEHQNSIKYNHKQRSPRFGSRLVRPLQQSSTLDEWTAFKTKFEKQYHPTEDQHRFNIYMNNIQKIAEHNERYEKSEVSYKLGVNKFTDLHYSEILETMMGFNSDKYNTTENIFIPPANVEFADAVDWRTQGAVTNVKNQGGCGSCWTFSATGALEGQHFLKTRKLVSLSEQSLVDCSHEIPNAGCKGGNMRTAFDFVKKQGGIDTEDSYPYEAREGPCRHNAQNSVVTVTGYKTIQEGNENDLTKAVASVGPVSVAVVASKNWMAYRSGVFYDEACNGQKLTHAVLVVGYGTENGQDYWLVKNSWGKGWGDNGYIKMARNKNNNCGIAAFGSYPTL